jgi:SpoIID/LytB domain protein
LQVRRFPPAALVPLLAVTLLGPGFAGTDQQPAPAPHALDPVPDAAVPTDALPTPPPSAAPSAAPTKKPSTPDIVIEGSGWGHGVGLSQYGARAMALAGNSYAQILGYYFTGIRLGTLRRAPDAVRVNLFLDRAVDASRVLLQSTGRDGRAPTQPISVRLGATRAVTVPFGQTWELRAEGPGFVLRDGAGAVRARGGQPARVEFQHLAGHPSLLRLPQVGGTYQWGVLEVTHQNGPLQPVLVLGLEPYLRGIAEVPSDWPIEALKAQALSARTYAVRQVARGAQPGCACHLGATPLHQAYAGWAKEAGKDGHRWVTAVRTTTGQVVTYNGQLAWTYYSSSHGGHSENSEESWAFPNPVPYLRAVADPWSTSPAAQNPRAAWQARISNRAFARALGLGLAEVHAVHIVSRTAGGTPRELEISGVDRNGAVRVMRWKGTKRGIAGADLKLLFRAELPSQQIRAITLTP